jgi:hypothetical protein
MSLLQGERFYHCVWQRPDSQALPDDLTTIFLGASAVDSATTNLIVEYASTNMDAAEQELDSAAADLL